MPIEFTALVTYINLPGQLINLIAETMIYSTNKNASNLFAFKRLALYIRCGRLSILGTQEKRSAEKRAEQALNA